MIKNSAPVFIFQMGKVGSSSLEATLKQVWDGPVVHGHKVADLSAKALRRIQRRRKFMRPVYVICPIREPLSRNVSAFFENWERDTGLKHGNKVWGVDEVRLLFLNQARHNVFFEFFDKEFRPFTGIDVFAEEFCSVDKYRAYKRRGLNVLVYRSDLDRSQQLKIISEFLNLKRPLEYFVERNIGAEKEYSETYELFRARGVLPESYIRIMCESRICKHFWSDVEIEHFISKWRVDRLS